MLKNIFPFSFIILLVLAGCSKDSNNNIYTGVLEGKSIQVPVLTPGKILEFCVDTGEEVQVGDTLAVIDIFNRLKSLLSLQWKQLLCPPAIPQVSIRLRPIVAIRGMFQKYNTPFVV